MRSSKFLDASMSCIPSRVHSPARFIDIDYYQHKYYSNVDITVVSCIKRIRIFNEHVKEWCNYTLFRWIGSEQRKKEFECRSPLKSEYKKQTFEVINSYHLIRGCAYLHWLG